MFFSSSVSLKKHENERKKFRTCFRAATVLGERDRLEHGGRGVHSTGLIGTIDVRGDRETGKRGEGWIQVDELKEALCMDVLCALDPWCSDHERDTACKVKVGMLGPLAMLSKLIAMITRDDNKGVVGQTERVDLVENHTCVASDVKKIKRMEKGENVVTRKDGMMVQERKKKKKNNAYPSEGR
jgi:hypothetical protein